MPRVASEKTNFAAGQIDSGARVDRGKPIYDGGVAAALNMRILNGRGIKRRPGAFRRFKLTNGKGVGCEFTTDAGGVFKLIFTDTKLEVLDSANAVVQTITSQPWTDDIVDELYFGQADDKFVVTHNDFWPRMISVTAAGVWSVALFAFSTTSSGSTAQPYWNFQAKGVTLTPSALTGAGITLTTSANHFVTGGSGHTGTIVRYVEHEILITAVTNQTTATGTVVDALPQTVNVTIGSTTGYLINESVQGVDSGAKGFVADVTSATVLKVIMTSGLTGFSVGEVLVGDGGSQSTISVVANTTPAATTVWDEQAFSTVRGYPGGNAWHRKRLYFFDMRDIPRGISGSAAGFYDDHKVGANDGDAFFELVPVYKGQRVLHVVSADQGLVITDKATYYLPEYGNQVITPSTVEFRLVAPTGAKRPKPTTTEQGVMFIEAGSNRIIGVIATGQVQSPWQTVDISAFWTELMTGPRSLAADINITGWPERYAYVINDDGTVAVMRSEGGNSDLPVGWVPWQTDGAFRSLFCAGGSLFAITQKTIAGADTWLLEEFDDTIFLDCAEQFYGVDNSLTGTTIQAVATGGDFQNQPANDGVELISSNAGDTTQTWTVIGTTFGGNTVVVETGTLNGTTQVSTVKTNWGVILAVKLSAVAAGTVTIREASGNATIITLTAGQTSKGITTVTTNTDGHDVKPTVVAGGASTKVVGLKYTGTDDVVAYQAATLNGTTAVIFPSAVRTATEVYNGDVAAATSITIAVGASALPDFASDNVEVMSATDKWWSFGEFAINSSGVPQSFDLDDGLYIAGFDMVTDLELLPPKIEHPAYEHGMRFGIPRANVHVKDTSVYSVNDVLSPAYRAGEDTDAAPPLRTETKVFGVAGRARDKAVEITQTIPSPLEVLGITHRVNF